LAGALLLASAIPYAAADAVDAKLLRILRDNGSITPAQYAELSADLSKQQAAAVASTVETGRVQTDDVQTDNKEVATKADLAALQEKIAWAANTVISGDVRVRQEHVQIEDLDPQRFHDRQRVRARLAIVSQVAPDVEAGIRVASSNNDSARSTNQDLDNYFTKKDLWLDRAYINWHPTDVSGLEFVGGKMAQPWFSVSQMIWDNDINPEGLATRYSRKVAGIDLFGSAGVFTLKNNVTGEGNEFHNDLRLYSAQLGARFAPAGEPKVTVGGSVYHYYNDSYGTAGLQLNGNTSSQFQLYEGFTQVDVAGLPLPLTLLGQYGYNANANGPQADKDTAWLLGVSTRIWQVAVNYTYRDVERNAVIGAFTDSNFAAGFTASRGHALKLAYNIAKNFNVTTSYYMTESNASSPGHPGAATDTWQLDLMAAF
jgi:hypothetical protein